MAPKITEMTVPKNARVEEPMRVEITSTIKERHKITK